eukprot:1495688-Rhodomonas_salina.1
MVLCYVRPVRFRYNRMAQCWNSVLADGTLLCKICTLSGTNGSYCAIQKRGTLVLRGGTALFLVLTGGTARYKCTQQSGT